MENKQELSKKKDSLSPTDCMLILGSLCRCIIGGICVSYGIFPAVGDFRLLYIAVGLILLSPSMLSLPKWMSKEEKP